MLKLQDLKPAAGSRKKTMRVGRGTGSGRGCTAGYGYNGSKCRAGDRFKAYFEGGETPMSRRIGKRGFVHEPKIAFQIVNLGDINKKVTTDKEINTQWLFNKGLIRSKSAAVKILGTGDFSKSCTIQAQAFSSSAKEKIEKAKGKAEEIACV